MRRLVAALVLVVACGPSGQSVTPAPSSTSPTLAPTSTLAPTPTLAPASPTASPMAHLALISELRSPVQRAEASDATSAKVDAVVAADTAFALRLYQEVASAADGNAFISPYSVSTALSLALAAARGNTADEIRAALGVRGDDAAWHAARNAVELALADQSNRAVPRGDETATPLTLEATNAIFGQADYPFRDQYLELLARYYGAGLETVDFLTQPEPARLAINDWVAQRTRDRIPQLLEPGAVDSSTRAVLLNAVYFKAGWFYEFSAASTEPAPFHLLNGSEVDVPMMHDIKPRTTYVEGAGWAATRLPYWGSASMIIVVPDEGRFADIENAFDATFLTDLMADLGDYGNVRDVDLKLPRWESESILDLIPMLQQLGIRDAFDQNAADLSGMTDFEALYIGTVAHQANVTVDEEGTEAAAATAEILFPVSRCCDPATLVVDRPFIYLIRDDITGEILFMGRLLEP